MIEVGSAREAHLVLLIMNDTIKRGYVTTEKEHGRRRPANWTITLAVALNAVTATILHHETRVRAISRGCLADCECQNQEGTWKKTSSNVYVATSAIMNSRDHCS